MLMFLRGGLALSLLLLYVVEALAIKDPDKVGANNKVGDTTICPVFISSRVAIRLPHHGHNGITLLQQTGEFFVTDRSIRRNRGVPTFDMTGWRVGRKDSFTSTGNNLGKLALEPPVRLLHRIVPKENFSSATHLEGRGFPIVAKSKIHHDQPIAGETIACNGHHVRPLIALKLGSGSFKLMVGNPYASSANEEHQRWKARYPQIYPLLKAGYVVLLVAIAFVAVFRAHLQLVRRWSWWGLLRVLLMYVIAGGIVFHVMGVMLFA